MSPGTFPVECPRPIGGGKVVEVEPHVSNTPPYAVCSTLLLLAACVTAPPADAEARAAVGRAIPYLRREGARWIEDKKCVSCHRVGNMIWALAATERAGFPPAGVSEVADWAVDATLAPNTHGAATGSENLEGVAQLLLAGPVRGRLAEDDVRRELIVLLRDGRAADGSWPAGGQLPMQKRPKPETAAISTLWIGLALLAADDDPDTPARVATAASAVDAAGPGTSTEWFAARLLLADRLGQGDRAAELAAALRARQRDDGGWNWAGDDPSDALGTGLALYALTRSGVPPADPAVAAGRRFLIAGQNPDGSWPVPGTKRSAKGRTRETSDYWGAAWATLALIEEPEPPPDP